MAMAMASCRGTRASVSVGPCSVRPCVSTRSSMSVPLRSAFVGLRLQGVACSPVMGPMTRRSVVVRAAAPATKKPDQAEKRARQNERRRIYNKSRKSEIHTRMKKAFLAMDGLKKKTDASEEDIKPVESLIADAFSTIDKAVKVGTLHRNKGGNQKSRLSRAKRTLLIQLGMYTSVPSA